MSVYSLLLIALALSLDAFGVAISIGISNGVKFKNKAIFTLSFGFFQFLFSFIGAYSGFLFNTYIASVPQIIGGIIIALVGVLMIKEGLEDKKDNFLLHPKMYLVLGISVSIDAMVVGFTALNKVGLTRVILGETLFIGLITLIISSIAFVISKYLKKIEIVAKYADYAGGIMLVLFGIKMIFL